MNKRRHPLLRIARLLTFLAVIIHVINKLILSLATFKNISNTKGGDYYNWRFGNIFYTKQGSGSPILLIHDLSPTSSLAEWGSIVNELSENHTVYAIDLLGCGHSSKPKLTYTNFLYVQLVADFVENIIGQKTDVVASGLSGSFVVMACANDKNTFDKVLLINPNDIDALNQIPSKSSKISKSLLELPLVGTLAYNILTSKSSIEFAFIEEYLFNPFAITPSTIDTCYESAHLGDGNGKYLMSSIIGNYIYFNISHGLQSIHNQILVVNGESYDSGTKALAQYTSLKPTIKHQVIPATKYLPQQESPEQLLNLANDFLNE